MAGGSFGGGTGTVGDPYLVEDAADLNAVRIRLTSHYRQTANISLAGFANWDPLSDWPAPFEGSYDGDGHTITNLTLTSTTNHLSGLFGALVGSATITDLRIPNASMSCGPNGQGGILAGWATEDTTISDVHVSGSIVTDKNYIGGMIGVSQGTVTRCSADCTVAGRDFVGGLIGMYARDSTSKTCSQSFATGTVTGRNYAGGLAGLESFMLIANSYSMADVTGSGYGHNVGGLAGEAHTVVSCFSAGAVSGGSEVGGLLGWLTGGGTVTNSYYDSTTSGQSDTGRGEPRSTADMKRKATFAGWDFVDVWAISDTINSGYPALRWYDYPVRPGADPYGAQIGDLVVGFGPGGSGDGLSVRSELNRPAQITLRMKKSLLDEAGVATADIGEFVLQENGVNVETARVQSIAIDENLVTVTALSGMQGYIERQTPRNWRGWEGMRLDRVFTDLQREFRSVIYNGVDTWLEAETTNVSFDSDGVTLTPTGDDPPYGTEGALTLTFSELDGMGYEWLRWTQQMPRLTEVAMQYRHYYAADGYTSGWTERRVVETAWQGLPLEVDAPAHEIDALQVRLILISADGTNTPRITACEAIARTTWAEAERQGATAIDLEDAPRVTNARFNNENHLQVATFLAERYGYVWRVQYTDDGPTLQITRTTEFGTDRTAEWVLVDGANCYVRRAEKQCSGILNRLFCYGAGNGPAQIQTVIDDEVSQAEHGIYPGVYVNRTATTAPLLTMAANAYMDTVSQPYWEAEVMVPVTPELPAIAAGDRVPVVSNQRGLDFVGRVQGVQRDVTKDGETLRLALNHEFYDYLMHVYRATQLLTAETDDDDLDEQQVATGVFGLTADDDGTTTILAWEGTALWFAVYRAIPGVDEFARIDTVAGDREHRAAYSYTDQASGFVYKVSAVAAGVEVATAGPVPAPAAGDPAFGTQFVEALEQTVHEGGPFEEPQLLRRYYAELDPSTPGASEFLFTARLDNLSDAHNAEVYLAPWIGGLDLVFPLPPIWSYRRFLPTYHAATERYILDLTVSYRKPVHPTWEMWDEWQNRRTADGAVMTSATLPRIIVPTQTVNFPVAFEFGRAHVRSDSMDWHFQVWARMLPDSNGLVSGYLAMREVRIYRRALQR